MKKVTEEKEVGVTFDENLMFEKHIAEKGKKANSMWRMLRKTFDAQIVINRSYPYIKQW